MVNIKKDSFSLNKFFLRFLILLMGSLCLLSSVYSIDDAELSWSMDTSTNPIYDDSGNNKEGSITGATYINSGALLGSGSYNFNGDDYISVNHNYNTQYLTASIIIKPNSVSQGTALLMGQYDTAGKRAWKVDLNGDEIGLIITNGGVGACKNWITNNLNIIPNNIYQIDFTFNSGNPKIYVNGNEITSFTKNTDDLCGNNFFNTDVPTMIGGVFLSGNPTGQYNGVLDQFMIYNRVLSSEEITQKYLKNPYDLVPNGIQTDIQEFYNSSNIDIEINTSNTGNLSYSLNNGTLTNICNNCNTTTLSLNSLSEGVQSILFESVDENGAVNTTQTFNIDLTNPSLDVNITEINSYVLNLSSKVSYNDSNLNSCTVSGDYDGTCQDIITFTTNGNKSLFFNVSDLAGNINTTNISFLVNPTQYIYFENSTNDKLTNFTINNQSYNSYFQFNIYDYGLGPQNFTFRKGGYKEFNFNINITNTSNINTTYYPEAPFINISIKDLLSGNLATKDDFTLVVYNENDDISKTYEITNNNVFQFRNFYAVNKNLVLNLVDKNDTVITNKEIVAPFKDTNINFYTTTESTLVKNFEVLNKNLRKIKFEDVKLYAYLKNGEFVHLATKETDIDGTVSFNVVQSKIFYTVCHTDQDNDQACLNQIAFDDIKDDYQIIHLSNIKGNTRNVLEYLEWSIDEEKTNTTSKILFYYEDKQTNVDSFCYDVSRIKNNTITFSESKCSNNYEGLLTQTYSLSNNEVLEYSFYYVMDNQSYLLNKFTSYPTSQAIDYFSSLGIFNLLFLLVSLGVMGFLLNTDDFDIYTVGFLGIMLVISLIQAYFNKDYISLGTWSFMAMQKFFVYIVRAD